MTPRDYPGDVGQIGHLGLFDEITLAGEHPHQARDDPIEQAVELIAGGRARLLKDRFTLHAPIHPVEHETMQVDVDIGRRAESLDERHRAGVGGPSLAPCLLEQEPCNDPVHDTQHRGEQLRVGGEQNPQRDRKRQDPLPDRHARDHVIDQIRGCLGHAPRPAGWAETPSLARKRDQLLLNALGTTQAQKTVGEDAAFEIRLELGLDELGNT